MKSPARVDWHRLADHPLAGLLTAAAVIRLLGVTTRGIQYDDAFSILLSGRSINDIITGTAADTMPPLYYLILHFWEKAGTSIAFLRLPGILFSLGIIYLAYRLVERLTNRQAAIWTAAILAVSPLQYYHAQDIRMYSLSTMLILGWIYGAIRPESSWKKWLVTVLCATGALNSHALAGFGLLAPYVYFVVKKDWKNLRRMIAAGLASIILYLPWLLMVPGQIAKVQKAFWTPVPGPVEVIQTLIMAFGDIPAPPLVLGFVLFAALCIITISSINLYRNRNSSGALLLFVLMMVIPPVCLFALSYLMRPMFVPRAFLNAYVGLAACLGIILSKSGVVEKYLIGSLIGLCAVATLPFSITYNNFPRSPFESADRFLETRTGDGVVILHDNKLSYFPSKVYAPELETRFLADQPGSANDTLAPKTMSALDMTAYSDPGEAVRGYNRVYFVVYEQTIKEYAPAGGHGGHPVLKVLDKLFGKPKEFYFGDLLVLDYTLENKQP